MSIKNHESFGEFYRTIEDGNLRRITSTAGGSHMMQHLNSSDELNVFYTGKIIHDLFNSEPFVRAAVSGDFIDLDWFDLASSNFIIVDWTTAPSSETQTSPYVLGSLLEFCPSLSAQEISESVQRTNQNARHNIPTPAHDLRLLKTQTPCGATIFGSRLGLSVVVLSPSSETHLTNLIDLADSDLIRGQTPLYSCNNITLERYKEATSALKAIEDLSLRRLTSCALSIALLDEKFTTLERDSVDLPPTIQLLETVLSKRYFIEHFANKTMHELDWFPDEI